MENWKTEPEQKCMKCKKRDPLKKHVLCVYCAAKMRTKKPVQQSLQKYNQTEIEPTPTTAHLYYPYTAQLKPVPYNKTGPDLRKTGLSKRFGPYIKPPPEDRSEIIEEIPLKKFLDYIEYEQLPGPRCIYCYDLVSSKKILFCKYCTNLMKTTPDGVKLLNRLNEMYVTNGYELPSVKDVEPQTTKVEWENMYGIGRPTDDHRTKYVKVLVSEIGVCMKKYDEYLHRVGVVGVERGSIYENYVNESFKESFIF
jgi:hypothetical protein